MNEHDFYNYYVMFLRLYFLISTRFNHSDAPVVFASQCYPTRFIT